jgi:hypothetical protein
MLKGKFWITDKGVFEVDDYETFARRRIFRVNDVEACEFPSMSYPVIATPEEIQVFSNRLVSKKVTVGGTHTYTAEADTLALDVIQREGCCLGMHAMVSRGWVKVRDGSFYFWEEDAAVLEKLRHPGYWQSDGAKLKWKPKDQVTWLLLHKGEQRGPYPYSHYSKTFLKGLPL